MNDIDVDLTGKVAFITGAGMGFGRRMAFRFAKAGAAIAVTDIDLPRAEAAAAAIREQNGKAHAIQLDVADEAAVGRAAAEAVEALGGVDILVNNAGKHLMKYNKPFGELPTEEIRALFDVNMMGVIFCTLALKETMRRRGGGAVINISSIAGFGSKNAYGVSKLAVRGLTIAFAHELAEDKIRVNAIAPGLIATEQALEEMPEAMVRSLVDDMQVIHRLGEMDDIANMALFLVSPAASFITGETIKVSGGMPLAI